LDGLTVSGEATGYYWLPFFEQLAADPELNEQALDLHLLNPRWVKWFKRCFPEDHKSDQKDPYYIAERTRTRPPQIAWQRSETLPLRFFSRYRFHLAQDLTREKNYFMALLFLKLSDFQRCRPFADAFGLTCQQILSQETDLAALAAMPPDQLADYLAQLSANHLPKPEANAARLQLAIEQSFPLAPALAGPVQDVLDFTTAHINFLQAQCRLVEAKIRHRLPDYPAIEKLTTIPGLGLILAAGIGAEIGHTQRFLQGRKWDKRRKRYRPRTLRDAEDAVAKIAGLWWPKYDSGDFVSQDRHLARSGNPYLCYYSIQAADRMRLNIPAYTRFYDRKFHEVPKHQHKRALVMTARKGIGLFVGLLHRNEAFCLEEANRS